MNLIRPKHLNFSFKVDELKKFKKTTCCLKFDEWQKTNTFLAINVHALFFNTDTISPADFTRDTTVVANRQPAIVNSPTSFAPPRTAPGPARASLDISSVEFQLKIISAGAEFVVDKFFFFFRYFLSIPKFFYFH